MMKIGELASKTGLATSRIRFYERMGLLNQVERQANGYRMYPAEAVVVLNLITSAQAAGFSLDELRKLMPENMQTWEHEKLVSALRDKVNNIDKMQRRLTQTKQTILAVLEQIEGKPEDMSCAANAQRVMSHFGLDDGGLDEARSTQSGTAPGKSRRNSR